VITCGACGAESPDRFKFCPECASPLRPAVALPEERKVVTSLFCDLAGFTAMSESADPEDVRALLGRYFAAARSAIEAFGGVVEKFIGDAVVGVFGVPAAHEDDPERAVRAGLRIVEAVEGLTRPDGSPLELRVGVNTGEALVRLDVTPGSGEGLLTGDAVNTAARIQSVAPVMGVGVGRSTYEATKPIFDYAELEPATVKGKTEPVQVWQAVAPLARFGTDITRRHDGPLVGREIDLSLLKGVFDKTVAASSPQLVTIVGEPGLGKSRLVAELFGHVDTRPGLVTWRQGRCLPYGEGITFWAFGEVVKAHAGIYDTDTADVAERKLDAVLPEIDKRAWLRQRLLPLLGMEASSRADQGELFTAWRTFLESVAEAGPTVVVFEDLHWADPAMLAFIEHLADQAEGVPLLLLATARPELFERHPEYGRGLRNTTTITLTPLTDGETTRLVGALLETIAVPEELRLPLVERAGGNPLFAEEYVRLLQDRDLLEHLEDQVRLRPEAEMPLSDSVQAMIAARLDNLIPDHKALLADAAVIGKVFWAGAVAAMSGKTEDDVVAVMRELSRKELVRPVRTSSMTGQREYTFWHLLTCDVAYAQLPRASRAARHVAAAEWIEAQAGNRVDDVSEVLAHHYTTALDLAVATSDQKLAAELRLPTLRCLLAAGERALALDAGAAQVHLERALALAPEGHELRGRVLLAYGRAARYTGDLPRAQGAFEEAVALFRAAGLVSAAVDTLAELSPVLRHRGDARWWSVSDEMLALAETLPRGPVHVRIYTQLAFSEGMLGHYDQCIEYATNALDLAEDLGLPTPAQALAFRGTFRADAGDVGGIDDLQRAIALAMEAGRGLDVGMFFSYLAIAMSDLHGPAAALAVADDGLAYTETRGISGMGDGLTALRLEHNLRLGNVDASLALAEERAARREAADDKVILSDLRGVQTLALLLKGNALPALDWLDWMIDVRRGTGEPRPALSLAARVHASVGHHDQAIELLAEMMLQPGTSGPELPSLIRTLISLDRLDLAEQLIDAEPFALPASRHARVAAQAALAEARGDHHAALDAYRDVAQRWHDFTMVVEEAFALLGQGRCLLALDRGDEATAVLEQAGDMFAKMGARPALAKVEELLASLT
jgi:class 3 adenylate cyclase/tetratricopeptide (TPR) repeat protein